ncbi:uncharacterized protein [Triticum aestivum]|uniref:uncharacterized protein n=1 Tax=Triticum aestivum TaxID=4565 RepID=UPI001D02FB35|nr:uncharacterized protein LOC123059618 [Triticum aestivum]
MLKIQTATTWGEVKGSDRSEINPKQLGHMEHGVILSGAIHPSSATMKPKILCSPDEVELVCSIDMHPTEPWILMSHGLKVSIWNYQTQVIERDFNVSNKGCGLHDPVEVTPVKFIPEVKSIVMGDIRGHIRVIRYDTMEEKVNFDAHNGNAIESLAVRSTGTFLLSAGYSGMIKLWKWENGLSLIEYKKYDAGSRTVTQLRFNANTFLSFQVSGMIKVWSIDCPCPIAIIPARPWSNESWGLCKPFDYLPTESDRKYMITTTRNDTCIWNLDFPKKEKRKIWNLETKVNLEIKVNKVHTLAWTNVVAVACHPTLPLIVIVTGHSLGTSSLHFWSSINYRLVKTINIERTFGWIKEFGFAGTTRLVVIYGQKPSQKDIYGQWLPYICNERIEVLEIDMKALACQQEKDWTSTTVPLVETSDQAATDTDGDTSTCRDSSCRDSASGYTSSSAVQPAKTYVNENKEAKPAVIYGQSPSQNTNYGKMLPYICNERLEVPEIDMKTSACQREQDMAPTAVPPVETSASAVTNTERDSTCSNSFCRDSANSYTNSSAVQPAKTDMSEDKESQPTTIYGQRLPFICNGRIEVPEINMETLECQQEKDKTSTTIPPVETSAPATTDTDRDTSTCRNSSFTDSADSSALQPEKTDVSEDKEAKPTTTKQPAAEEAEQMEPEVLPKAFISNVFPSEMEKLHQENVLLRGEVKELRDEVNVLMKVAKGSDDKINHLLILACLIMFFSGLVANWK